MQPSIGVKAPFPGFVRPALATSIDKVPNDDRWIHEIKFDGYRVQLHIVNDGIRVYTRRGNDWTKRFRKVANNAYLIIAKSAIIDGEVWLRTVEKLPLMCANAVDDCMRLIEPTGFGLRTA